MNFLKYHEIEMKSKTVSIELEISEETRLGKLSFCSSECDHNRDEGFD